MYDITRRIEIDAGHRVTHHHSKCKNLHGHRYVIFATVAGPLITKGSQEGMILDFSFLKEEMVAEIDEPCDHTMILWQHDPMMELFFGESQAAEFRKHVADNGYLRVESTHGKFYLMETVPTAENLAQHWFERLAPRVKERTDQRGTLTKLTVYETPNCYASYEGMDL